MKTTPITQQNNKQQDTKHACIHTHRFIFIHSSYLPFPSPKELIRVGMREVITQIMRHYTCRRYAGVKGLVLDENGNAVYRAVVIVEGREQVPFRTSKYGEFWKLLLPGDYNLVVRGAFACLLTFVCLFARYFICRSLGRSGLSGWLAGS